MTEKVSVQQEEWSKKLGGLSAEEVEMRTEAGLVNRKLDPATRTTAEIIKTNVFTYFNLIFFMIAVLLIMVGSFRDLTFLPVILSNTLIGIVQELRSKKVLDELSMINMPKVNVIRGGNVMGISSEELVTDDVILLNAGNQIPADAVVIDGNVKVNEALLTGEADEILKETEDVLLSGSFIVSGNCAAKVEKVGRDSYIAGLMLQATKSRDGEQSEMIRSLNRLVKAVGVIIIPIGIVLFVQQYFYGGASLKDSVTGMVAALIGMIPEGLYLLASVAMVVSVMRLGKQKVLVHDMKCIETLARVNVLCVDKTGTITVPEMEVDRVLPLQENAEVYLAAFVRSMAADNHTMEALQNYFEGAELEAGPEKGTEKVFGFSSETKYSGAIIDKKGYCLGAPEFLLREDYETYKSQVETYSKKGSRVLLFAEYEGVLDGKPLTERVRPLAIITLTNTIREGAVETFSYFVKKGVEVKVISGDHPATVSEIAKKAGVRHAEHYVDAVTLKTEGDVKKAAKKYTVFGRVTPEQKRLLVDALKEEGKTVAMTGDGVNDILALKNADCSIAMVSGSEAAAQVSQLVLLDDDFNRMPQIVMEGRRVVNNIERTASLYLVKNIFSMLLAVYSMIFMLDYPLEPSQVSLIGMFTIGIPSFFLALEQNKNPIQGHFMVNVLVRALPAGITDFLVVSGLVIFCREFEVEAECISTCCTILVSFVGFLILYQVTKPVTGSHAVLMIAMVMGLLFCMLFAGQLFAITEISRRCTMLLAVFLIVTEPVLRYLSKAVQRLEDWCQKLKF